MTPAQWQRVREVFEAALEVKAGDREAWLETQCAWDQELHREVNRLLAGHEQATRVFGRVRESLGPSPLTFDLSGRRVGPYELLDLIGKGGMGVVYRASRADAAFEKIVAIKLIGFQHALPEVERAFYKERQILATLDHPNIARLLDGGTTPEGLLYLVMELVEGEPIDEYCRRMEATVDTRLLLFEDICAAVQQAHRNLIVHRDLKPKNILVTPEGQVKLLDFGIAKVLSDSSATGETLTGVMTPQYASPEQLLGKPITTASDVYSLGAVLFELLSGNRPYQTTGPLDETVAVVCHKDPPLPSATAPPGIASELRGELDNIVMKAMAKDPDRRYGSVEQFRDDIRRHRTGLPVLATGDSRYYRFQKFVRRRRAFVAAAALIGLTMAVGVATTMYEARVANHQRILAERRYNDVRTLATTVLFDIHDSIKNLAGSTEARKLAIDKGLVYLEALARDSEGDVGLQAELAAGYERAGSLLGSFFDTNTEGGKAAAPILEKALALRKKVLAQKPDDAEANAALVLSFMMHGNSQVSMANWESAVRSYRQGLAISSAAKIQEHPAWLRARARLLTQFCNVSPGTGDAATTIQICEESIGVMERLAAAFPHDKEMAHLRVLNEGAVANSLRLSNHEAEAVPHFRRALSRIRELVLESPGNANLRHSEAAFKFYLASALRAVGDSSALEAYADAVRSLEANLEGNSGDTRRVLVLAGALERYSEQLRLAGREQEAESAYARGLALYSQLTGKRAAGAGEMNDYASALAKCPFPRLRNPALALQMAQQAKALTNGRSPIILDTLAWAYYQNGRIEEAIGTARTGLALLPSAQGPSAGLRKDMESSLAQFESKGRR